MVGFLVVPLRLQANDMVVEIPVEAPQLQQYVDEVPSKDSGENLGGSAVADHRFCFWQGSVVDSGT